MVVWRQPDEPLGGSDRPALFLDRDGVVVVDRNYLADPAMVELVPGAAPAMARARAAGFLLIGMSNQSGLGRGFFGPAELRAVMKRLDELLEEQGAEFDAFYYCPHAPDEGCGCRKPAPGLMEEARARFAWDVRCSWMVGDKAGDVAFGRNAGLRSILVRTGHGTEQEAEVRSSWSTDAKVAVAENLAAAVDLILAGFREVRE